MKIILNKKISMNIQSANLLVIQNLGRRLTRQRRVVMDVLRENQGHLDAEALYNLAKKRDPNISLATVYRSLALLREAGFVQENRLGEDHNHFETVQTNPHYHFTCLKCGRVVEFEAPEVMEAANQLGQREGLQVVHVSLNLSGYCRDCQEENTEANHG